MTFRGLKLMVCVLGLVFHSLAAPSPPPTKLPTATAAITSPEDQVTAQKVRDTLIELIPALITDGAVSTANGRKSEVYHHNSQNHKPQHHNAISTLIHLLLTIGSAFAPLIGAVVGPLLTNIANGITWAISNTIASGFSPPHGLFSPELGHGVNHIKEHPTSYTAEGQLEVASDTSIAQLATAATAVEEQAEPATVDDTRNEVKKT